MKQFFLVFVLQLLLVACSQQSNDSASGSASESAPNIARVPAPAETGLAKNVCR